MHYAGDAVLAMFDAVVEAVSCAAKIQEQLGARHKELSKERKVQFRVGVNLGDVIVSSNFAIADPDSPSPKLTFGRFQTS